MKQKKFQASRAGYTITAEVTVIGKDLSIALVGGDTPHIGTVTWVSNNGASDTIRFPSHHGRFHKDDVLSEILIKQLQPLLPGSCVITAGIHVNGITKEQI
ncbi:MAG TPA: amino acid decarboxylase, partial [Candidatus Enterococcus stercoravium]|nr:amino acid decarboxylase [Candidatus Enterococcus stercoravium]